MDTMKIAGVRSRQTDERGVQVRPGDGGWIVEVVLAHSRAVARVVGWFPTKARATTYAQNEVERTGYVLLLET